jgi:cation/acetate symporter
MAITIFLLFVAFVLGLSFYLGRSARSAGGYFAAGGQIHWGVNGIAFAGDYLSAASFLGICGMIAFKGYDGFLYSIGYLAGWIVALFVVAEPMKRLGRYTFTDALDCNFNYRGIQLAAGISTLVVSMCYLIPQMVGAGSLVTPLLGLEHHWGVIMVGGIVIFIVATAGMASTTYVQFLKGGLLIIFSTVLAISMCTRGIDKRPDQKEEAGLVLPYYEYERLPVNAADGTLTVEDPAYAVVHKHEVRREDTDKLVNTFYKLSHLVPLKERDDGRYTYSIKGRTVLLGKDTKGAIPQLLAGERADTIPVEGRPHVYREIDGQQVLALYTGDRAEVADVMVVEDEGELFAQIEDWWVLRADGDGATYLEEIQSITEKPDEAVIINGAPKVETNALRQMGRVSNLPERYGEETGGVGPFEFFAIMSDKETTVELPKHASFAEGDNEVTVYYPDQTAGNKYMRPGLKFPLDIKPGMTPEKARMNRLNFISLMLALFCGTAALPHILIRYYTVPSPAAARKSTIVAIAAIGFFYVLTLYLGTGATVNGAVEPTDSNMSAPLLARSFSEFLFAIISAIAFATVLGTVSGLIVASSGALAHDLLDRYFDLQMQDKTKVLVGKLAAFTVGLVAIILGIVFEGMNVSFLVGWAFAVAASANLPAIVMLLFWKKTTAKGIVASILVGTVAAIGIILLSPDMYTRYGYSAVEAAAKAPFPISQPGIISIPLSFLTLVVVSLLTQKKSEPPQTA